MDNNITLKTVGGQTILTHDGNKMTFKRIDLAVRFAAMLRYVLDGEKVGSNGKN